VTKKPPFYCLLLFVACLTPCVYLPTLATRFDFADDGVIVYPGPARSLGQRLKRIWHHTLSDFRNTGPFRPMTWAHWEAGASFFGPHDFSRRVARLLWSFLAAGMLVWFLSELRLQPTAILLTTALAMWNPYRGEIWLGLGLTEAFAMPYALLGLVCAIRASRGCRPLPWDIVGSLCLLTALGVKNTFVALVPVQVFLRLSAGGLLVHESWRRHGYSCCWYLAALVLPITHFVLLKLNPRPTHYVTGFSWPQVLRMLKAIAGAISWDVMAPGLALAGLALWLNRALRDKETRRQGDKETRTRDVSSLSPCLLVSLSPPLSHPPQESGPRYRLAIQAGLLLLFCGIGIYLPINGVAGRYTIPAVWGADLWLAVLFSALAGLPKLFWRRLAFGVVGCGLLAVLITNVGRQEKVAARNAMLWQALEYLEEEAPRSVTVAWLGTPEVGVSTPELPFAEAVHFQAHLQARGRSDLNVQTVCRVGAPTCVSSRVELAALALSGTPDSPEGSAYRLVKEFRIRYWAGRKSFQCYLWERTKG
jgi:hypothetical protein